MARTSSDLARLVAANPDQFRDEARRTAVARGADPDTADRLASKVIDAARDVAAAEQHRTAN